MKLNEAQRQLVQDNMGLVGKVIKEIKSMGGPSRGFIHMTICFRSDVSAYVKQQPQIRAAAFQPTPIG